MPTKLLKAVDVARIADVSEARVYALVREGILPAVRLGKQIRVDADVLQAWIKNGGCAYPGGWRKEAVN